MDLTKLKYIQEPPMSTSPVAIDVDPYWNLSLVFVDENDNIQLVEASKLESAKLVETSGNLGAEFTIDLMPYLEYGTIDTWILMPVDRTTTLTFDIYLNDVKIESDNGPIKESFSYTLPVEITDEFRLHEDTKFDIDTNTILNSDKDEALLRGVVKIQHIETGKIFDVTNQVSIELTSNDGEIEAAPFVTVDRHSFIDNIHTISSDFVHSRSYNIYVNWNTLKFKVPNAFELSVVEEVEERLSDRHSTFKIYTTDYEIGFVTDVEVEVLKFPGQESLNDRDITNPRLVNIDDDEDVIEPSGYLNYGGGWLFELGEEHVAPGNKYRFVSDEYTSPNTIDIVEGDSVGPRIVNKRTLDLYEPQYDKRLVGNVGSVIDVGINIGDSANTMDGPLPIENLKLVELDHPEGEYITNTHVLNGRNNFTYGAIVELKKPVEDLKLALVYEDELSRKVYETSYQEITCYEVGVERGTYGVNTVSVTNNDNSLEDLDLELHPKTCKLSLMSTDFTLYPEGDELGLAGYLFFEMEDGSIYSPGPDMKLNSVDSDGERNIVHTYEYNYGGSYKDTYLIFDIYNYRFNEGNIVKLELSGDDFEFEFELDVTPLIRESNLEMILESDEFVINKGDVAPLRFRMLSENNIYQISDSRINTWTIYTSLDNMDDYEFILSDFSYTGMDSYFTHNIDPHFLEPGEYNVTILDLDIEDFEYSKFNLTILDLPREDYEVNADKYSIVRQIRNEYTTPFNGQVVEESEFTYTLHVTKYDAVSGTADILFYDRGMYGDTNNIMGYTPLLVNDEFAGIYGATSSGLSPRNDESDILTLSQGMEVSLDFALYIKDVSVDPGTLNKFTISYTDYNVDMYLFFPEAPEIPLLSVDIIKSNITTNTGKIVADGKEEAILDVTPQYEIESMIKAGYNPEEYSISIQGLDVNNDISIIRKDGGKPIGLITPLESDTPGVYKYRVTSTKVGEDVFTFKIIEPEDGFKPVKKQ